MYTGILYLLSLLSYIPPSLTFCDKPCFRTRQEPTFQFCRSCNRQLNAGKIITVSEWNVSFKCDYEMAESALFPQSICYSCSVRFCGFLQKVSAGKVCRRHFAKSVFDRFSYILGSRIFRGFISLFFSLSIRGLCKNKKKKIATLLPC